MNNDDMDLGFSSSSFKKNRRDEETKAIKELMRINKLILECKEIEDCDRDLILKSTNHIDRMMQKKKFYRSRGNEELRTSMVRERSWITDKDRRDIVRMNRSADDIKMIEKRNKKRASIKDKDKNGGPPSQRYEMITSAHDLNSFRTQSKREEVVNKKEKNVELMNRRIQLLKEVGSMNEIDLKDQDFILIKESVKKLTGEPQVALFYSNMQSLCTQIDVKSSNLQYAETNLMIERSYILEQLSQKRKDLVSIEGKVPVKPVVLNREKINLFEPSLLTSNNQMEGKNLREPSKYSSELSYQDQNINQKNTSLIPTYEIDMRKFISKYQNPSSMLLSKEDPK